MREMGWSYQQLQETPTTVVMQAFRFLTLEAKQRKRDSKKNKK